MEAGPQAGCVAAYAIGAWTHRAGGSEKAFTISLSMATCVSGVPRGLLLHQRLAKALGI
jgi:hypothetical protein